MPVLKSSFLLPLLQTTTTTTSCKLRPTSPTALSSLGTLKLPSVSTTTSNPSTQEIWETPTVQILFKSLMMTPLLTPLMKLSMTPSLSQIPTTETTPTYPRLTHSTLTTDQTSPPTLVQPQLMTQADDLTNAHLLKSPYLTLTPAPTMVPRSPTLLSQPPSPTTTLNSSLMPTAMILSLKSHRPNTPMSTKSITPCTPPKEHTPNLATTPPIETLPIFSQTGRSNTISPNLRVPINALPRCASSQTKPTLHAVTPDSSKTT